MDDLIDELIDLFSDYSAAKKELVECVNGCDYDAGYFCQQQSDYVEQYKDDIKIAVKKLIKEAIGEGK